MKRMRRFSTALSSLVLLSGALFPSPASAGLYAFTSFTFTPCSAIGISGPTLSACQTTYAATTWKSNSSYFNVSSGIQLWTVPATGTYQITVAGAAGGAGKQAGGKGATISGEFNFSQGTILKILVGQVGAGFASGSGGGGGGTFVVSNTNSPLIIAGGGGGGGGNASATHFGRDATFLTSATASNSSGAGGTATAGGIGSTIGYGGGGGGSAASGVHGGNQTGGGGGLGAAGGAGFGGDGGNGQNSPVVPKAFLSGGAGGYRAANWGTISTSYGGFGGGGNGTAIDYVSGGGGGGGYTGGGGGDGLNNGGGGGGGGSYNSGTNAQNINVTNSGAGTAAFVFLNADTTPPSITSGSSFSVSENSTSIATLTVNETSTWSIFSGVDSLTVSIDTNTGLLRFKIGQNYESPGDADSNRSYLFTVKATDEADNSSTSSITVTLTDLNEAPVITSNSGGASASITISENTSLVTSVATTDPDSVSALSYSVSGTDANDFAIGTSSGVLTFATLPNFEAPVDLDLNNIYLLVVEVSDGFLTDTQTITITVTNVTDAVAISTPTLSAPPSKGVTTTITYQLDVAGRATFFASGKRIPGCITKTTSGSSPITASCSWKPTTSGAVSISVSIKPTGSGTAATNSSSTIYQVVRRTGIR